MAAKEGLASALGTARQVMPGDQAPIAAPAEQLALLPVSDGQGGAEQSVEVIKGAGDPGAPRGPGRPAGAKNRRTEEWIDFYFASGLPDPMLFLGRMLATPLDQLAKDLGVGKKVAGERQLTAAKELLPYIHQKLPQAIELDKGVTILQISVAATAVPTMQRLVDAAVVEVEENQQLRQGESGEVERVDVERGS